MSLTPEYTPHQQSLISAVIAIAYELRMHRETGMAVPQTDLQQALGWAKQILKDNEDSMALVAWIEQYVRSGQTVSEKP